MRSRTLGLAGVATLAGATIVAGIVHVELKTTLPPDGAILEQGPSEVRLVFTEAVVPDLSTIELITQDGARLSLTPIAKNDEVLVSRLPGLGSGAYMVEWSTVSRDGHKIEGRFGFRIDHGERAVAAPLETPATPPSPQAASEPTIAPILAHGIGVGLLLALAGLLFHAAFVPLGDRGRRATDALALVTPIALAIHVAVWVESVAPRGVIADAVTVLGTTPGTVELSRLVLAVLAGGAVIARRPIPFAAVLALAALLGGAGLGHAAEITPAISIPLKATHLAAVAVWLGGLLVLAIGGMPDERFRNAATRVSSYALVAVAVIVVSGFAQAALIAGSPMRLMGTTYGLFLGVKTLIFVALVAFAAHHRFTMLPGLGDDVGPDRLRRSVVRETIVFAVVVLLAGALASTPPPGGM